MATAPADLDPLKELARLCRTAAVRETLERLGNLLCHSLDAAGVRWQALETGHTVAQRADGCDACCSIALLGKKPVYNRAAPLPAPEFRLDLRFRTQLASDWEVTACLADRSGAFPQPPARFWSREVLLGDLWHLNTDLDVLELDGLFDDWEQSCLLEVADFVGHSF
ncbi:MULTISPECIES: hypothetical protein [unclassified Variovorax]|uniref:hypothetical protein n=1 Tax=unclassified Variovorax TaxID=663243 RepID=UPI000838E9C5|nr:MULTISPECIES: hypothetical protein [unclassified Variovorax]